jgi:DNA polymerase
MGEQDLSALDRAVQSYAHWWREAGLHTATDTLAHGWRQAPVTPFWQRQPAAAPAATPLTPAAQPRHAEAPAPAAARTRPMPESLPAFLDWLAQDKNQPEAAWDGALILPPALAQARLLVIVEMPTMHATNAETLLDPAQRRFIDAMMASLAVAPADRAIVSLAARRPPGGLLDEETLGRLAARMTQYLRLARPRAAIILGDRTSRALIGAQWSPNGERLHKINHGDGILQAIALAGPELLMSRPVAKANSWQALRRLHGIVTA